MKELFNKIKKFFLKIREAINQIDIPDDYGSLTKEELAEVKNANKVQERVHEQKSIVPKAQVNEVEAQVSAEGKVAGSKGNNQRVHGNA